MREFFLALLYQNGSKEACIERRIADTRHDIWYSTDMVEVAVSDENGAYAILAFLEVMSVGQDEIDTRSVLVGELDTDVDHDDVVAILDSSHVLTDFFNTAEWNDTDTVGCKSRNSVSFATDEWLGCWSTAHRFCGIRTDDLHACSSDVFDPRLAASR
jgi:hypothetical protein